MDYGPFNLGLAYPFSKDFGSGNYLVLRQVIIYMKEISNMNTAKYFQIEELERQVWDICLKRNYVQSPIEYFTREKIMQIVEWVCNKFDIGIEWT